jgi:hypothetical protein
MMEALIAADEGDLNENNCARRRHSTNRLRRYRQSRPQHQQRVKRLANAGICRHLVGIPKSSASPPPGDKSIIEFFSATFEGARLVHIVSELETGGFKRVP